MLKSYKFSRKDVIVIHNLIVDIKHELLTTKTAFKELEEYCKNKTKVNIFKMVINNFTDKNNYHSGTMIDFRGGQKVYHNINNPTEAYNKALNDDFINYKETIKVSPYHPSDFNLSSNLIKNYLISINQKVI